MVGTLFFFISFFFFLILEMVGYLTESKRKFQNIEEINEKMRLELKQARLKRFMLKRVETSRQWNGSL